MELVRGLTTGLGLKTTGTGCATGADVRSFNRQNWASYSTESGFLFVSHDLHWVNIEHSNNNKNRRYWIIFKGIIAEGEQHAIH